MRQQRQDVSSHSSIAYRLRCCWDTAQMRAVLLALLTGLVGPALAAEQCPLNRVVFKDTESGREFVAQRVAVDYQYLCAEESSGSIRHYSRPQKKLEKECTGPFGETIVEGLLDGEKVYAVYKVEKAAPCCVWYSYPGDDKEVAGKVKEWLQPLEMPVITLGDEWYTISPPDPSFPPDQGPLAGGSFVPATCRAG